MNNDECQMTNVEGVTKPEAERTPTLVRLGFGSRVLFVIRHSSFIIP